MRGLNRGDVGAARSDERGALIVLIAVFAVVMMGMAALVVDVGALLDERHQLQNGADAAVLAVAHSCALGSCDATQAPGLADANSRDADSAVDSVTYPAVRKVQVTTSTRGGGTSILPYSFAQALSGVEGQTVRATATAVWGPIGRATAVRLAVSQCDVALLGISTVESVILFHGSSSTCAGSSGNDTAGAFGWLDADGTGNPCELTVSVNQTASADPGSSGPASCLEPNLDEDVLLPVFDDVVGVTGTGTNATYTIKGFARFHLTGYRFGSRRSVPPPACTGSSSCIQGYFVRYVTASEALGGADFGASTVNLFS